MLDDYLGEHRIGDFYEAGNVRARTVIDGLSGSRSVSNAIFMDVRHNADEAIVDFLAAPTDAELVLALLQA